MDSRLEAKLVRGLGWKELNQCGDSTMRRGERRAVMVGGRPGHITQVLQAVRRTLDYNLRTLGVGFPDKIQNTQLHLNFR